MATNNAQMSTRRSAAERNYSSRPIVATVIIIGGSIALLLSLALSISIGATSIKLNDIVQAIFHFNDQITDHHIIRELRIPRAIAGMMVGLCFAVSGAIMQGLTRNPLADSGLLGINAGANFMIAVCFAFFPGMPFMKLIIFAFLGAAIGAGLVFGIGSLNRRGLTPLRLVLAGAAVSALLVAISEGIALHFHVGQDIAFWYAGGVASTKWLQIKVIFPWVLGAFLLAIILSRSISLLSLGEEIAAGLGQRTFVVKVASMLAVLVLAGSAVSIVGAVGFVGLIIPHVTRYLVGVDYRWIIPCSAILGGLLVIWADVIARTINPPYETPIGALIALIGVPFFLFLARKERREL